MSAYARVQGYFTIDIDGGAVQAFYSLARRKFASPVAVEILDLKSAIVLYRLRAGARAMTLGVVAFYYLLIASSYISKVPGSLEVVDFLLSLDCFFISARSTTCRRF